MTPDEEIASLKEKMRRLLAHISNPGQCRKCPAPVYWVTSKTGKPSPLNADGTSHFSNCPGARQVRVEQNQKRIAEQRDKDYGKGGGNG